MEGKGAGREKGGKAGEKGKGMENGKKEATVYSSTPFHPIMGSVYCVTPLGRKTLNCP